MSSKVKITLEPIAIIGMGCRFPGEAESIKAFWKMLCEGRDGVIEVPGDRWDVRRFYDPDPNKPGKTYVRHGAYLRQPIDRMDALFFGISPREAESLDPQQRLVLEVAWEALEDAGLTVEQLAGSATGVFMGGFIVDHMSAATSVLNRHLLNTHSAVSFTHTILSARIAYVLDLHGPCMTLDTACSSSLVALHQACQSIRAGESELALVGGVNIMHHAETPVAMCKSQFLARDGRSKSFDARGDGYGRGEGAGVVVLKPLSAARRDGDGIYAVIRGTGVNQDGRTDGITVPNEKAQAALIRQVCERSGISPNEIAYFEAHGTGTLVGDPKECGALGEVIGKDRNPDNSCWIGGVKANVGHLEAAAGVAGIIKTALCLHHRQIPPVANLQIPNPRIDFEKLGLRLPRKLESMPQGNEPGKELPLAGVNSFGYGGTNAHAILQGLDLPTSDQDSALTDHQGHWFLPLSARSDQALRALAGRYHDFLTETPELDLQDICWSAATRRSHHHFRLAILGKDRDALLEQLALFADGKGGHLPNGRLSLGQAPEKPVFVFTGMGPQWWAMGRELLASEPVYREMAEQCEAIFKRIAGWSILEEMGRDEKDSRITQTDIAQPANFVLQAGLDALWRSKGIVPAAVVGHSLGEVTAAYVSGALGLEDAIKVSYHRSRLQRTVAGQGEMLAVANLSEKDAEPLLDKYGRHRISIGAINSPTSVTLSGDGDALREIADELEAQGIFNRFLQVELAYHSPVMDALQDERLPALLDLQPRAPSGSLYSTVTGELVERPKHNLTYWCDNIREPVRFDKVIQSLAKAGHTLFLEIGPHPVLAVAIKENLIAVKKKAQLVASLKRKKPESDTFYRALGDLYTMGCVPDWSALYPEGGRFVRLPHYPWQRQTYWLESEESRFDRLGDPNDHPLLGHRINTPEMAWEQPVNGQYLPWLPEHRIQNFVILPGAAYVEIGLSLLERVAGGQVNGELEELRFQQALVITSKNEPVLRTQYDPARRTYSIHSYNIGSHTWTLHAEGRLSLIPPPTSKPLDVPHMQRCCPESIDVSILYERFEQRGMEYGEAFRGIREIRRGHEEVLARIVTDPGLDALSESPDGNGAKRTTWRLHPTRLDVAFQSLLGILDEGDDSSFMPVSIGRLRFYGNPGPEFLVHGRLTRREEDDIRADLDLFDEAGNRFVEVRDLQLREIGAMGGQSESRNLVDWIYRVEWEELPVLTERQLKGRWLLFMDRGGRMDRLAERLEAEEGITVTRVLQGDGFSEDEGRFTLRGQHLEDMRTLAERIALVQYQGVVYGWGMDCDESRDPDGSLAVIDGMYCARMVYDAYNEGNNRIRFFVLTQNAQSLGDPSDPSSDAIAIAQGSLVGLGRVISGEQYYYTRCCLIDLPAEAGSVTDALVEELLCDGVELEIALRGDGQRLGYRLKACGLEDLQEPEDPAERQPVTLQGADAFVLERQAGEWGAQSWQWRKIDQESPRRGQVAIHVGYAILPPGGLRRREKTLIAASGRQMTSSAPGPAFLGLLPIKQLASRISLPAEEVIEALPRASAPDGGGRFRRFANRIRGLPDRWQKNATISDAPRRAASLLPFTCAIHALEEIAGLKRGERVLIHPSNDGMDLAAVQVARNLGARVFATYADEAKAEALRALRADQVLPLEDFADAISDLTDGKGVQVVLNTLDGEAAQKSLLLLGPFGRFVDFNRTFEQWHVLSRHQNVTLHAVDVLGLRTQEPDIFQELLNRVASGFERGDLQPLDIPIFRAGQVSDALEAARGRSVVLEIGAAETLEALPEKRRENIIRADGSYLVTGGFGGFGITLAFWLADQGAKSLVLVGRRGAATPEAEYAVKGLKAKGVSVRVEAADVGKEEDMERLIREIQAKHPPLIGVFHTAGVLDDAMLTDLTPERLRTVMQPKAMGAWYLHRHTLDLPLDCFVLFSSLSALTGNPGQGNYVAANAFLDQLAHARRARGLPGLSLNWGMLADVGMVAKQELEDLLEAYGIGSFTRSEAMEMLDLALRSAMSGKQAQLGLMNIDWQSWLKTNAAPAVGLRYRHLADGVFTEHGALVLALKNALQDLDEEGRVAHVVKLLVALTAQVMRLPEEGLDPATPLSNLGLDSLMGMELRGAVESNTSVNLSILDLQSSNMEQLAEKILEKMGYS
uniref:Acyl transferase domain-containing protein n=1 Tax=Candidatus Kentrum sp. LFY TaxID=2126342 RepID=A0A450UKS5_9GAMM|nr:MAG: Acyl transferase domain-containing protein [Candidatus Kentron sp. LFY]